MRRTSWLILACASLLHLGLLVGWRWQAPLVPYFFDATVLSGGRGLDFYSVYQAGYNARHGQDIYEGDPSRVHVVVPYFTPYRYLPPMAYTVGAALSLVAPLRAYEIWVVTVELTLLACVAATYWYTRYDLDLLARLAAMWLVFTPYYLELFMGQFSLVQGALVFAMLLAATTIASGQASPADPSSRPGRWFDAVWIGSVLWKINTIVFIPVQFRLRRWRALVAGAVVVAGLTLPYFVVFPAHWSDFINNNFGSTVAGHELGNLGFRQLVYETLSVAGASPLVQRIAQLAVVGVVAVLALLLTLLPRQARITTLLSLWLTAFFLISPQVWEHHYVMLLPVLVIAYRQRPNWQVAGLWLLLALPTPFGFTSLQSTIAANHDLRAFALQPVWALLLQHASKAVPAVLLFAYLAADAVRAPQVSSPAVAPRVSMPTAATASNSPKPAASQC